MIGREVVVSVPELEPEVTHVIWWELRLLASQQTQHTKIADYFAFNNFSCNCDGSVTL